MTAVKEFTPVLMYVNHEKIDGEMKNAKEHAERINSGLAQLEKFLEKDLTDQEKIQLLENGPGYLHEKLKEQFQFPNATDQFNLEAMGKVEEYTRMKHLTSNIHAAFHAYDFEVNDGEVVLSENGSEAIIEKNTHSTQNDAQSEAFKLAEKLVKDLNKAKDKEWITRYDLEQVKRSIKIINLDGQKFVPNYSNISTMNEGGGFMSNY